MSWPGRSRSSAERNSSAQRSVFSRNASPSGKRAAKCCLVWITTRAMPMRPLLRRASRSSTYTFSPRATGASTYGRSKNPGAICPPSTKPRISTVWVVCGSAVRISSSPSSDILPVGHLHALHDVVLGHLAAGRLVHPLVADRLHGLPVEPVEVDAVVARRRVQGDGDVHEAEADRAFPECAWHGDLLSVMSPLQRAIGVPGTARVRRAGRGAARVAAQRSWGYYPGAILGAVLVMSCSATRAGATT